MSAQGDADANNSKIVQAILNEGIDLRLLTIEHEPGFTPGDQPSANDVPVATQKSRYSIETNGVAAVKKEPLKVAIVGSRNYSNMDAVREYVRKLSANAPKRGLMIVSGTEPQDRGHASPGVDETAVEEARVLGLPEQIFKPKDRSNKRDYIIRNGEIVEFSDAVVGFWDGESRGTGNVLATAYRAGKLKAVYGSDGGKRELDLVRKKLIQRGFLKADEATHG